MNIQLLNRCLTELHLLINGWQTDEGWYSILFIYNAWESVPRQLCTYKLRLVIPAPRRFPDVAVHHTSKS